MLEQFKTIGVALALDDFGTGYSSLGYILKVPFNKIKIDQSFVRGASIPGSKNATIIRAIVDIARDLSMETTAEGVETQDELATIKALGCSLIQGYVFGRPVPAEEAANLVAGASAQASGFMRARGERRRLLRAGSLHNEAGTYAARFRNVSAGGALVECSATLTVGSLVRLDLGTGDVMEAQAR